MPETWYYEYSGQVSKGMLSKARGWLRNDLVKYTDEGWVVLPKDGYNKTTHWVDPGVPSCSCQRYQRMGEVCTHILAVKLAIEQKRGGKIEW